MVRMKKMERPPQNATIYVAPNPVQRPERQRLHLPSPIILGLAAVALGNTATPAKAPPIGTDLRTRLVSEGTPTRLTTDFGLLRAPESPTAPMTPFRPASRAALKGRLVTTANFANGYAQKVLVQGSTFVASARRKIIDNHVWVRGLAIPESRPSDSECVWIQADRARQAGVRMLSGPTECAGVSEQGNSRDQVGMDFNGPDHTLASGAYTKLRLECDNTPFALNYDARYGVPYDELPPARIPGGFFYRFTTLDGKRAVGMVTLILPGTPDGELTVWGSYPRDCVPGHPRGGLPLRI